MQTENESTKKTPFSFKTKVLTKKNPALSRGKESLIKFFSFLIY